MRLHRKGGFDALYPKPRADRGLARGIPPELAGIKTDEPLLSVRLVIKRALDPGLVPDGARLAESTVDRLLQRRGLTTRRRSDSPPEDLRRFAYENAGELWMADAMHGPKAGCDPHDARRRRKTCLLAAIDDATRVIPYAAFAFSESSDSFLTVLRQALERRGVPRRLYADYVPAKRQQLRKTGVAYECGNIILKGIAATSTVPGHFASWRPRGWRSRCTPAARAPRALSPSLRW